MVRSLRPRADHVIWLLLVTVCCGQADLARVGTQPRETGGTGSAGSNNNFLFNSTSTARVKDVELVVNHNLGVVGWSNSSSMECFMGTAGHRPVANAEEILMNAHHLRVLELAASRTPRRLETLVPRGAVAAFLPELMTSCRDWPTYELRVHFSHDGPVKRSPGPDRRAQRWWCSNAFCRRRRHVCCFHRGFIIDSVTRPTLTGLESMYEPSTDRPLQA